MATCGGTVYLETGLTRRLTGGTDEDRARSRSRTPNLGIKRLMARCARKCHGASGSAGSASVHDAARRTSIATRTRKWKLVGYFHEGGESPTPHVGRLESWTSRLSTSVPGGSRTGSSPNISASTRSFSRQLGSATEMSSRSSLSATQMEQRLRTFMYFPARRLSTGTWLSSASRWACSRKNCRRCSS